METRKLAAVLITLLNAVGEAITESVEGLEKLMSGDDDEGGGKKNEKSSGRASRKKDNDDEPSEDDVIDAVKAAQKVLDSEDIKKILKRQGKAARASEVEPEHRQAVIDALEKAVEDAD